MRATMVDQNLRLRDLSHTSPEFDDAYEIFTHDIPEQFLEERKFLRNRLRVRDEGPRDDGERCQVQDGYTLHLLVAKQTDTVVGAVYGHLISKITPRNRAVGFVIYVAVLAEFRRRGIASLLLGEVTRRLEVESQQLTGKPLAGMVYEIETEGKTEITSYLRKLCGGPLDITYYQPALRDTTSAEPMQLWFRPLDPPASSLDELRSRKYPSEFIVDLVRNLLVMEYIGPQARGFDRHSFPLTAFLESVGQRTAIGFIPDPH